MLTAQQVLKSSCADHRPLPLVFGEHGYTLVFWGLVALSCREPFISARLFGSTEPGYGVLLGKKQSLFS